MSARSAGAVLMVGGPADGTWRVIEGYEVTVHEMPPFNWKDDSTDMGVPMPVQHRYTRERVVLFGHELEVAVHWDAVPDRNRAIMRTILQRDVASRMGVL